MLPFSELLRKKEWLYFTLGVDETIFIRPSSGDKIFTGQLFYKHNMEEELKRTLNSFDLDYLQPMMVVIAKPQTIIKEWRLVVAQDQILSGSLYHDRTLNLDYRGYPKEVKILTEKILSETTYRPDKIWTMDFCQTSDQKIHLLEIGGFSCAGIYECDLEPIVREVSRISLENQK
jgi:hypothetical protein